jgi:hypothetical protein
MLFKAVAYIAAGVVLGFALGGIPARRELAAVQRERDALQVKLENLSRPNLLQAFLPALGDARAPGDPLRTATGARSAAGTQPRTGAADAQRAPGDPRPAPQGDVAVIGSTQRATGANTGEQTAPAEQVPAGQARAVEVTRDADDSAPSEGRRSGTRDLLGRFDQLVTAQRARSAAARSALIEQVGLEGPQLARFDSAVTRMNGKLAGYGEEVIAQAASDEPPAPAQALGLGHDVSGILYEGQKELDAVVGEESEGVDPSALEIWNYVDLEQWRPYVESQLAGKNDDRNSASSGEGTAGAAAAPAPPAK